MKQIKFVIVSPRQKYGGSIVLHQLCKILQDLGYASYVYYSGASYYKKGHKFKFWVKHFLFLVEDTLKVILVKLRGEDYYSHNEKYAGYVNQTVKNCKRKILPFVDRNTVVVYPDVVYGNYLHAKYVVRWLLYYNRYGDDAYGKNDMFFAYRDVFNDLSKNPLNRILNFSYFNFDVYKKTNFGDRTGNCYIIRKGSSRLDLPKKIDGPVIDDLNEKEKVEVFNKCKYCISYDTQTAYSVIASICGCISVVIPENGKSWKDYRSTEEERYGVAFGTNDEEIDWAITTADKAKKRYEDLNKKGLYETKKFVEEVKKYFKLDV